MKIKFNKFERVAGLFVLTAILGAVMFTVGVAVKKGWFSSKVYFETTLTSAEGLHTGTLVQVAGLRAGNVEEVELITGEEVKVKFFVFDRFQSKIREDSKLRVVRPFIIGEKVLDISVGTESYAMVKNHAPIPYDETFDMMDLLSGRKLGSFLGSIEKVTANLRTLAEAFTDSKRTKAMIAMFDKLEPLINNLDKMSVEVTKLGRSANENQRIEKLFDNVVALTEEIQKLTPAIDVLAPELPKTTKRTMEALDEVVVLLKAMQKSFLLRGSVKEVKEEEDKKRMPASKSED